MKRILSGILLFGSSLCLTAQAPELPKEVCREWLAGKGGRDVLVASCENLQGEFAAAGWSGQGANGGEDIFLLLAGPDMENMRTHMIGRPGDDRANSIANTFAGNFLVAGYSTKPPSKYPISKKYGGKKDGWLLFVNEAGKPEAELLRGGPDDDAFVAAFPLPKGGYLACGYFGDQAWVVHFSDDGTVIWERKWKYHGLPTSIQHADLQEDGTLGMVGWVEDMNERNMLWTTLDADGNIESEYIFPKSEASGGGHVIALPDGGWGISGYVEDPMLRLNGVFYQLNAKGVVQQYRSFGGREADQLQSLSLLHDGSIALAGNSKSFIRGSRRDHAWLVLKQGDKWQEAYYGSKMDDSARFLGQLHNGALVMGGYTGQAILKADQAWINQIFCRPDPVPLKSKVRFEAGQVHYPGQETEPLEKEMFLPLRITADQGMHSLEAVIKSSQSNSTFPILKFQLPVVKAGLTNWVGLPLHIPVGVPPGVYALQVSLQYKSNPVAEPVAFQLRVGQSGKPLLTASITEPGFLQQGQSGELIYHLENGGGTSFNELQVSISGFPGKIQPAVMSLPVFPAGAKFEGKFKIVAPSGTLPDTTFVANLEVQDESMQQLIVEPVLIKVKQADKPAPGPVNVAAVWIDPNPDQYDHQEIVSNEREITLQIKIVSDRPLQIKKLCIQLDDTPCPDGIKFQETTLKGKGNTRTYSTPFVLKEGLNTMTARIDHEGGSIYTDPLSIRYAPAVPNLHLLSIGIPAPDLKYTVKDARNMAQTFSNLYQEGGGFGSIFLDTLLQPEQTTKTEILKALRRYQYRYKSRQVNPQDLLIVFISSHGLRPEAGQFRIAASDFDNPFVEETSLDFSKDILEYLQDLPCKKLFLVDACHSGAGQDETPILSGGDQWYNVGRGQFPDTQFILSSRSDEYSYEDDRWQNGAFSEALIECLNDMAGGNLGADKDADGRLNSEELFQYLQERIPALVAGKRPKTSTGQHPVFYRPPSQKPFTLYGKAK